MQVQRRVISVARLALGVEFGGDSRPGRVGGKFALLVLDQIHSLVAVKPSDH